MRFEWFWSVRYLMGMEFTSCIPLTRLKCFEDGRAEVPRARDLLSCLRFPEAFMT